MNINKNIQMKERDGTQWNNLYPLTLTENVYNTSGQNIDEYMAERMEELDRETTEKTKNIQQASLLGIENGADLSEHIDKINGLEKNTTLIFDRNATYHIYEGLKIKQSLDIDFNGSTVIFHREESNSGVAFSVEGEIVGTSAITGDVREGYEWINVLNPDTFTVGDIIHIDSDELFNDDRVYYMKGGTFEVTKKDNNRIALHRSIPFPMNAGATIEIFKPNESNLKNMDLINEGTLSRGLNGVQFKYTKNSMIENVTVDRFNINFMIEKSVHTVMEHVTPKRSMYSGSGESYGIAAYSTTGLNVRNSTITSGRHGLAVSGFTPAYDTYLENSTFANETEDGLAGLDFHAVNYNATVIGCTVVGAHLAGNVTVISTNFLRPYNVGRSITLAPYNQVEHANYIFQSCNFAGDYTIQINPTRQNPNGTNTSIGQIIVDNCQSRNLNVKLVNQGTVDDLHVNLVKISGTNNLAIDDLRGRVDLMIIEDMVHNKNQPLMRILNTDSNIKQLVLRNIHTNSDFSGTWIRVNRVERLLVDNLYVRGAEKTIHLQGMSTIPVNVVIRHSDFQSVSEGVRIYDGGSIYIDGNVHFNLYDNSSYSALRTSVYE